MSEPLEATPRGAALATDTSAASDAGTTVVVTEAVLLPRLGSVSFADTLAVLVSGPAALGVTTIVALPLAPRPICPIRQVTVPPAGVHPAPETKVTLAGREFETVTPVAALGPASLTVKV